MIDVRVRKHDGIDLLDRDREPQVLRLCSRCAVPETARSPEGRLAGDPQDVARAGDFACRADELDFHNSLGKTVIPAGRVRSE